MKQINYKSNKGFSMLAIILVIIAVIVAISAWSLSGDMNLNNNINNGLDIQANTILNDSDAIKLSYDNIKTSGADISAIVFIPNTDSTTMAPNILDPATGVQNLNVNLKNIRSNALIPEGIWIYNNNFLADNVGGNVRANAILIAGIKDDVCKRINYIINGAEFIPTKPAGGASSSYVSGATVNRPMANPPIRLFSPLIFASTVATWNHGCISATNKNPDNNIYFRYLQVKI